MLTIAVTFTIINTIHITVITYMIMRSFKFTTNALTCTITLAVFKGASNIYFMALF